MGIIDIVLLAIGLSMDCLTVAIASGLILKEMNAKIVIRMALMFAIFQATMPLVGYYSAYFFKEQIQEFDHWVAFIILFVLGVKMIRDGVKIDETDYDRSESIKPLLWSSLIMLSFATSIDALATGIIFVAFDWLILITALSVIFVVTFLFTILGNYIGSKYGGYLELAVEILGGLILIGIGVKVLVEHIWFQ